MTIENLITDNIDIWTAAIKKKSVTGRGTNKKIELYGIKKLRELILELAVRGKLVPQDPNDEPASILLAKVNSYLCKQIGKNELPIFKRDKSVVEPSEFHCKLPENWAWCELQDIVIFLNGKAHEQFISEIPNYVLINSKFVSNSGKIRKYATDRLTPLNKGDIAMVMSDVPNGKALARCYLVEQDELYTLNQRICGLTTSPHIDRKYLMTALDRNKYLLDYNDGQKQTNLKKIQVMSCPISIPPLTEQHRIVAKVDELMALCDQLEQQTESSIDAHKTLVEVLLNTLTDSKDTTELQTNWARVSEFFDTLFTTEHSIKQLKQSILQLAVMGKLVPQDPSDEPASKLLARIADEKAQLITDKKIKKQKALPPITEEEKPFDLPNGWECERLGNLTSRLGSGSTPRGGQSAYVNEGVIFLRSQNVWNDGLKLDDTAYISDETHIKMSNTCVYPKDVLLNITGASLGRSTIFPAELITANVSQHVTVIRLIDSNMCDFLHLGIQSPLVQKLVWGRQVGMAIEGLSKKVLEQFEFPVPPLKEQFRIINKVKELMVICEQLKSQLNQAQQTQLNLTDALVSIELDKEANNG